MKALLSLISFMSGHCNAHYSTNHLVLYGLKPTGKERLVDYCDKKNLSLLATGEDEYCVIEDFD